MSFQSSTNSTKIPIDWNRIYTKEVKTWDVLVPYIDDHLLSKMNFTARKAVM